MNDIDRKTIQRLLEAFSQDVIANACDTIMDMAEKCGGTVTLALSGGCGDMEKGTHYKFKFTMTPIDEKED